MQEENSRRRRRLVERLVVTSILSSALFPTPVEAQETQAATFGGGLFVGYTFGPGRGIELGVEGFGTHRFDLKACSSDPRKGLGGSVQLGLIGFRDARVTLAGHGGGELARSMSALTGELGATYRFGEHSGFGIHTGIMAETLLLYGAFRYQWLLQNAGVGGGARFPGTYGLPGSCAVGRPLRTASGFSPIGAATVGGDVSVDRNRGESVEAVGHAWARDAQLECASIPAFLQLAAELLEQQAPSSLVERALAAACDEMRHAALCARLASRHLRRRIQPTLPNETARLPLRGLDGLVRLATESWLDGCIAEGVAAAHAACAAEHATDREARAAQRRIARDEQRHADLAWAILEWASERGGDAVRERVHALRDVECVEASAGLAPDGLERHGRLGAAVLDRVTREHVAESRRRLDGV
jgi:hypothetical protein